MALDRSQIPEVAVCDIPVTEAPYQGTHDDQIPERIVQHLIPFMIDRLAQG
mgnify:CR=1 FL=1